MSGLYLVSSSTSKIQKNQNTAPREENEQSEDDVIILDEVSGRFNVSKELPQG